MDYFTAIESFVRRQYNPQNDPRVAQQLTIQPYVYPLSFEAVNAGNTPQQTLNVAANADFVLLSPRFRAIIDAANGENAVPYLRVLLTDTGSQEQLSSQQVDITEYFSNPIRATDFDLPYPRIISGRSGLSVQLQNYSNVLTTPVNYLRVELAFVGVLIRGFNY